MGDFDLENFRLQYPQFSSVSDEVIELTAERALCFISEHGCACSEQSWFLMIAHLLAIQNAITSGGNAGGPVISATVGGVSVSFAAPPTGQSAFKFWLAGTPYGLELLALLAKCSAGGMYVGGSAERAAFRGAGGLFPNGGRVWPR